MEIGAWTELGIRDLEEIVHALRLGLPKVGQAHRALVVLDAVSQRVPSGDFCLGLVLASRLNVALDQRGVVVYWSRRRCKGAHVVDKRFSRLLGVLRVEPLPHLVADDEPNVRLLAR